MVRQNPGPGRNIGPYTFDWLSQSPQQAWIVDSRTTSPLKSPERSNTLDPANHDGRSELYDIVRISLSQLIWNFRATTELQ